MAKGEESKIVKKIMEGIRKEYPSSYVRKVHGNPMQHAGIPDIIGCVQGHFLGLEVKTTSGRVSLIQTIEGQEIFKADGIYGVVTSLEEALEIIDNKLGT